MDIWLNLRRMWRHDTFWRFMDALAPRGFGFVMHTWLIWHFGAEAYALPAWVITTFSLALSLIPDPIGYVLLARNREHATRRASLLSSWFYVKMSLGVAISVVVTIYMATSLLAVSSRSVALWSVAGALAFAASETMWAACGVNCFAMGKLISWTKLGIVLRTCALAAGIALETYVGVGIGAVFLVFSTPLLLACLITLPLPVFNRRSMIVGQVALRRYSIWTNFNAILLNLMMQAPVFFAGSMPGMAASATGQLNYAMRVLGLFVQPLMILQSVIVRDFSRLKAFTPSLRFYRLFFRGTGLAMIPATLALGRLAPDITPALWLIGAGLAVFTTVRFEFALLNALQDVRFLSMHVFLPVSALFAALVFPLRDNLTGVAIASALAYTLLTVLVVLQARRRIVFSEETR